MKQFCREWDRTLSGEMEDLSEKFEQMKRQKFIVEQCNELLKERDKLIAERDELKEMLAQKDEMIAQKDEEIAQQEKEIAQQNDLISQLSESLKSLKLKLEEAAKMTVRVVEKADGESLVSALRKYINYSKNKIQQKRAFVKELCLELIQTTKTILPDDLLETLMSLDDEMPRDQRTINVGEGGTYIEKQKNEY